MTKFGVRAFTAFVIVTTMIMASGMTASAQNLLSPNPMTAPVQVRPEQRSNSAPGAQRGGPAQDQDRTAAVSASPDMTRTNADWRIDCFSRPQKSCRLSQRQVNPSNNNLLIWVEITRSGGPKPSNTIAIMLPLGLRIQPEIAVLVDGVSVVNVPVMTCTQAGCLHAGPITETSIRAFEKAKAVSTRVMDMMGQVYQLNVSPRGFDASVLQMAGFLRRT